MRAPQAQQLSSIPPSMRNPPLHPYWYWRICPSGERQHSATGLPAAAKPLARGRFSLKYRFSIIRDGWKFNARPRPEERQTGNITEMINFANHCVTKMCKLCNTFISLAAYFLISLSDFLCIYWNNSCNCCLCDSTIVGEQYLRLLLTGLQLNSNITTLTSELKSVLFQQCSAAGSFSLLVPLFSPLFLTLLW